jgi:osmotically inducible protein OsmC
MPVALREAEIIWEGPLARGTGTLTSGSGALDQLAVTWASRTERPDGRTSPEELIAAAHASCFAMAFALVLGEKETPPDRVRVSASCTLDEVEGAPRITTIELTVRAQVPGLERPISSTPSPWPPSSARCPMRYTATSRSTCAASSSPACRPRRSDDDRACWRISVDAVSEPQGRGGRGHRRRAGRAAPGGRCSAAAAAADRRTSRPRRDDRPGPGTDRPHARRASHDTAAVGRGTTLSRAQSREGSVTVNVDLPGLRPGADQSPPRSRARGRARLPASAQHGEHGFGS